MPGPRRSEEDRQEDILRAAYDIAARRGLSALTLRAVAKRAKVSHGTVLFHFKRRDQLVAALLDRVLYATIILRVPYEVRRRSQPAARLLAMLRAEMERVSNEARHFRLFLEYWTLGMRSATLRSKIKAALNVYRREWRALSEPLADRDHASDTGSLAAVAVSLVHGCALQAVIDARDFDIRQHYDAAARLLGAAVQPDVAADFLPGVRVHGEERVRDRHGRVRARR